MYWWITHRGCEGSHKEDAKRLKKAEKSAGAKQKKVPNTNQSESWKRQQGQPMKPARRFPTSGTASGSSQPPPQAQTHRPKQPGPCFYCMEMGHLKATCPRLTRPYPLNIEPVNKCKTGGMVEGSVIDKHVLDACPPSKVGTSDAALVTHSGEMGNDSGGNNLQREEWSCEKDSELDIELGRFWELEQEGPQVSDVQGHLLTNINFWEQVLEAPPQIIECIREGYKLPLLSLPEPFTRSNHKSALQNKEFVNQAISDLTNNRCVVRIENTPPPICSPLSVVVNDSGKKWLVIDLRHLNQYSLKDSFKYEDLRTAMLLFQKEDYLFSFDLKSGYHHVDIHRQHQKYLGFAWDMGDGPQHYMFKVLPFGLATACYIVSKLLRPLVRYCMAFPRLKSYCLSR